MTKPSAKTAGTSAMKMPTNFDVWKETLTPEFIADHHFIALACGACPAQGKTCNKYDAACRSNFLNWARAKAEPAGGEDVPDKR